VSLDVTSKRVVESIAGHPTDTEVRKNKIKNLTDEISHEEAELGVRRRRIQLHEQNNLVSVSNSTKCNVPSRKTELWILSECIPLLLRRIRRMCVFHECIQKQRRK